MRKLILILFIMIVFLITACTQTEETNSNNESELKEELQELTNRINEKEEQIKELTQSRLELKNVIDSLIQEKDFFPLISNVTREFVEAHTEGDKEKLKKLLSNEMNLIEEDNILYVKNYGDDFEWFLFDSQSEIRFDDWVIQGYEYDIEAETFSVHIREFYSDINGESVSPPTFLNLTLKQQENEWKIIKLEFDV